MTPPDDIRTDHAPASETAGRSARPMPPGRLKEVRPESEVRGGPQAPEDQPLPTASQD